MGKVENFKIGDEVGYKSLLSDNDFSHTGLVKDIAEIGIPSCPKPMVKIKGKPGYVLSSHCTLLKARES